MQGSIHTTHGIAYQEESADTVRAPLHITIQQFKRKTVDFNPMPLSTRKIKPYTNPPAFNGDEELSLGISQVEKLFLLWRMMRQVTVDNLKQFLASLVS